MKRNYPENLIDEKFVQAKKISRKGLIHQNRKQQQERDDKVTLIFTHNRGNPSLHKWLREAKKSLMKNEKAKSLGDRVHICYKHPKNLKRIVGQGGRGDFPEYKHKEIITNEAKNDL